MCVCAQVRKCMLARAVQLSVAMLPRPVVRQQRKSGLAVLCHPKGRVPRLCLPTDGSCCRIVCMPSAFGASSPPGRPLELRWGKAQSTANMQRHCVALPTFGAVLSQAIPDDAACVRVGGQAGGRACARGA